MSKLIDNIEDVVQEEVSQEVFESEGEIAERLERAPAYMNRIFSSTRERVVYVLKSSFAKIGMGKYDVGSDLYMYEIYGIEPMSVAKANVGLGIYDIINDPLSAVIIDRMRTRWGKFKPFQYLAIIPNIMVGLSNCLLPLIAMLGGFGESKKLWAYMLVSYVGETINAFLSGGGYIDNVFTPNPGERSSLLTASKFTADLFAKAPEQITAFLLDMILNGKLGLNVVKVFSVLKTTTWLLVTIPGILWTFVSKERVPQSKKPPQALQSILSVFKNRPLLIYTLSGMIDGVNIGTSESLYFNNVLHFNTINIIGGIPGAPVSYASYGFMPKFRDRFSTKALYLMQGFSVVFSEAFFMLVGCIGGKQNGFYRKKLPMGIAFAIGNCVEMVFYATKQVIAQEINYEVLDYCEWKNGYRVEATVNLITGYIHKVQNILLKLVNAYLLQKWAGYEKQSGFSNSQSITTQWRMFIASYLPHIIFDFLSLIPMFFYNIDADTRAQMYLDLEKSRAAASVAETNKKDGNESNGKLETSDALGENADTDCESNGKEE